MKYAFGILFSLIFIFSAAQDASQYKYISVPANFSGFEPGQYQLNNYLRLLLSQKDYEVISENQQFWPDEAKLNPCHVLTADVEKLSSTFDNKLLLRFKDCNLQVVQEIEGQSRIKEFDAGYKDALKNASNQLKTQNASMPTYRHEETKEVNIVSEKVTEHPGTALFRKYSKQAQQKATPSSLEQVFVYRGKEFHKTDLENNQFVLNSDQHQQVLHFVPSARADVFHVQIINENSIQNAIGFYDGQTLFYEYLSENQQPIKVEFQIQ